MQEFIWRLRMFQLPVCLKSCALASCCLRWVRMAMSHTQPTVCCSMLSPIEHETRAYTTQAKAAFPKVTWGPNELARVSRWAGNGSPAALHDAGCMYTCETTRRSVSVFAFLVFCCPSILPRSQLLPNHLLPVDNLISARGQQRILNLAARETAHLAAAAPHDTKATCPGIPEYWPSAATCKPVIFGSCQQRISGSNLTCPRTRTHTSIVSPAAGACVRRHICAGSCSSHQHAPATPHHKRHASSQHRRRCSAAPAPRAGPAAGVHDSAAAVPGRQQAQAAGPLWLALGPAVGPGHAGHLCCGLPPSGPTAV